MNQPHWRIGLGAFRLSNARPNRIAWDERERKLNIQNWRDRLPTCWNFIRAVDWQRWREELQANAVGSTK